MVLLGDSAGVRRPPAVLHVDLDGAAHIYRAHGWTLTAPYDPLFESGLRNMLALLERRRLKATLFVIAEDVADPRKRELLEEARDRGHEIASHSVTHRWLTRLAPEERRRELEESRDLLARVLGVTVAGFRAPGFAIDEESLAMVEAAGYRYDSSLFPGPRRRAGRARASSEWPHTALAGRRLIELPLPSHAPLPFPFHPSYSLVLGLRYFRTGLDRFLRRQVPLTLLFHLTDVADPVPAEWLPGWRSRFFTLSYLSTATKLRRCEAMLDLVQQDFTVTETARLLDSPAVVTAAANLGAPLP
jgi:polysaccharide deacetylase